MASFVYYGYDQKIAPREGSLMDFNQYIETILRNHENIIQTGVTC